LYLEEGNEPDATPPQQTRAACRQEWGRLISLMRRVVSDTTRRASSCPSVAEIDALFAGDKSELVVTTPSFLSAKILRFGAKVGASLSD
jgi:hypothetical protein